MPWTVYCHTHVESGRRYVGLTKYTMMHRWNQHCAQAKRSGDGRSYFQNAIRIYGKDAFSHEALETCYTVEAANAAEARWVEELGTRDLGKGFNLLKGGAHTPHDDLSTRERLSVATKAACTPERRAFLSSLRKGKTLSPETRAKIGEASRRNGAQTFARNALRDREFYVQLRSKMSPETVAKIADLNRGRSPSPEERAKISAAGRGRHPSEETKAKLSVKSRNPSEEVRKKLSDAGRKGAMMVPRGNRGRFSRA